MKNIISKCLLVSLTAMSLNVSAQSSISMPVGLDTYRKWDQLPLQRIGVTAYMRSTYDRTGGGADASHFLCMNKEDENVTLSVKGKGIL